MGGMSGPWASFLNVSLPMILTVVFVTTYAGCARGGDLEGGLLTCLDPRGLTDDSGEPYEPDNRWEKYRGKVGLLCFVLLLASLVFSGTVFTSLPALRVALPLVFGFGMLIIAGVQTTGTTAYVDLYALSEERAAQVGEVPTLRDDNEFDIIPTPSE